MFSNEFQNHAKCLKLFIPYQVEMRLMVLALDGHPVLAEDGPMSTPRTDTLSRTCLLGATLEQRDPWVVQAHPSVKECPVTLQLCCSSRFIVT